MIAHLVLWQHGYYEHDVAPNTQHLRVFSCRPIAIGLCILNLLLQWTSTYHPILMSLQEQSGNTVDMT